MISERRKTRRSAKYVFKTLNWRCIYQISQSKTLIKVREKNSGNSRHFSSQRKYVMLPSNFKKEIAGSYFEVCTCQPKLDQSSVCVSFVTSYVYGSLRSVQTRFNGSSSKLFLGKIVLSWPLNDTQHRNVELVLYLSEKHLIWFWYFCQLHRYKFLRREFKMFIFCFMTSERDITRKSANKNLKKQFRTSAAFIEIDEKYPHLILL